jgi:MFS transporter, DHA1 family, multidrug resistance protein
MKSQKYSVAILFASLVIVMLGFGIAIPLMPFYVTHFNASGSALGFMMAIYSLMQFIFAPIWGQLSDRIGRKPVLLIGIAGYAISFFLQGISQNITQFILTRTLAGILSSATLPTAMAYIADTTSTENRSRGVGLMGAAMGVGMIFGPMLGGLLTRLTIPFPAEISYLLQTTRDATTNAVINLSLPFFASSLLALVAIPFIITLLPESLSSEKRALHVSSTTKQSRFSLLKGGLLGPSSFLFVLAFLLAFALANMEAVLALYGKQQFAMGPSEVGLLMGAMGVLAVIQQGVVIGPLTKKVGEVRSIQGGLVFCILGFVGLALSPAKSLFMAAALVFNIGSSLLQPCVTALASKRATSGQGEAMGINNSFQSLGRAVGPLWAGFAFDIYSTLSFWTGALIQIIVLGFSLRMLTETEPISLYADHSQPAPAANKN